MPLHDAFSTTRINGVPQARRVRARLWLFAWLIAGLLCPGMSSQAWDTERMLLAAKKISPRAVAGVQALQPVLTHALDLDDMAQLQAINQFFNPRILFRDDSEVWGQVDYWASPLEMLDKGAGDCEDYAIAKYFSLRHLGVPAEKLRITYVKALRQNRAHMVLTYYASPEAMPLVLDSLMDAILPASQRADLLPVYAFNGEGLWLTGAAGNKKVGDTKRLSRWQDVLKKMTAEGFPASSDN